MHKILDSTDNNYLVTGILENKNSRKYNKSEQKIENKKYNLSVHITKSKLHISYFKNHDSTLMLSYIIFTCHPFQHSSISLKRASNIFTISSPFDVIKLQKIVLMSHRLAAFHSQCQWTRIFLSFTNPMAMRSRESRYSSQCSRKLWFRHYYQ